jgi:hypothetical protein
LPGTLEEKMCYFQDVLRLPERCVISQKDVLSFHFEFWKYLLDVSKNRSDI